MLELIVLGLGLTGVAVIASIKKWAIAKPLFWICIVIYLLFFFLASNRKDAQE